MERSKRRGLSAAAIFAVALGIGPNTAIFSLVHAALLAPLPYPDGYRLISKGVWLGRDFRDDEGEPALKFCSGSVDSQGMDSHLRRYTASFFVAAVFLMVAAPAAAQGFGIGGRLAWIKNDSTLDVDSERFFGGQIRLSGARIGLEVSLDRHSTSLESLNQQVTETPIQVSLLLNLASGPFRPYLLGGPGWYFRRVGPIDGASDGLEVGTHDFGWHGGIGAEIRAGRHLGIHGDYRYTFLDFNDDTDEEIGGGILGTILPGHRGSMITLGATVYF